MKCAVNCQRQSTQIACFLTDSKKKNVTSIALFKQAPCQFRQVMGVSETFANVAAFYTLSVFILVFHDMHFCQI